LTKYIKFITLHYVFSFKKEYGECAEDAADIVSNLFSELLEERDNSESIIRELSAYLYRRLRNDCLDRQRHKNVRHRYEEYILNGHEHDEKLRVYDQSDVLSLMILQERDEELKKAIAKLPPKTRNVVEMRLEELSDQEIAEKLQTSVETVRVLISNAIKVLRKLFGDKK
jgi:RNA polymerase sigma-70 factor (ECF subfamily)